LAAGVGQIYARRNFGRRTYQINLRRCGTTDPETIIGAVQSARDYLQGMLDQCTTAGEFSTLINLAVLPPGPFGKMKKDGIGRGMLTAFPWRCFHALSHCRRPRAAVRGAGEEEAVDGWGIEAGTA
jgi:hypothetical protein